MMCVAPLIVFVAVAVAAEAEVAAEAQPAVAMAAAARPAAVSEASFLVFTTGSLLRSELSGTPLRSVVRTQLTLRTAAARQQRPATHLDLGDNPPRAG